MSNTCYCIICGEAFSSDNAQENFCELHRTPHPVQSPPPLPGVGPEPAAIPGSAQQVGAWQPGQVILGTYEVKGILGKGGFGQVFRVHHKGWNMDLAVKRALNLDEQGRQAFIDEAQKWIDLGLHPHIISCYYVRNIDGFPHTFAELAEGGSLESWIQREKHDLYAGNQEQVLSRILDIAIQFAWGLGYAHAQGLVHQDVKPGNALMTPDGTLKVTDFGLARAKSQSAGGDVLVTSGGYTPAYCSPEQAAGNKLSLKTDIWSWAVSVLEMFNGGVSWMGGQVAASALESYLGRSGEEENLPPMPDGLAKLLRECFQDDPQARPGDMAEIADRLTDLYQRVSSQAYPRQAPRPADLRADSLNNRALSLLDLGKDQEALRSWDKALEIDKQHPETSYNRGQWLWKNAKQTDQDLVRQMEAVCNMDPDGWRGFYLLGLVHRQRRDGISSLQALDKAATLSPNNSMIQKAKDQLTGLHPIQLERTLQVPQAISEFILHPDGRRLIYQAREGEMRLVVLDLQDGKLLGSLDGHSGRITCFIVSPNGRQMASASEDNTLRLWDLDHLRCLYTLHGHDKQARSMTFSPDGSRLISGADDHTIRVWDTAHGNCLMVLTGHQKGVSAVAVTPDGSRLVSGSSDGRLRIWDLHTGQCTFTCLNSTLGLVRSTSPLAISPDGSRVVIDGSVWDLSSGKRIRSIYTGYCRKIIVLPDGRNVLSHDNMMKYLTINDLESGRVKFHLTGHSDSIEGFELLKDTQLIISASRDQTLRLWDPSTGQCLRTIEGCGDITAVSAFPDGMKVISSSLDKTIRIWDVAHTAWQEPEAVISQPSTVLELISLVDRIHQQSLNAEQAIQDGKGALASDILQQALDTPGYERDPALLELWARLGQRWGSVKGLRSVQQVHILMERANQRDFVVSPDRSHILTPDLGKIQLWDIQSGQAIRTLEGYVGPIGSLALTPDGNQLVMGCFDKKIRVFDLQSGQCQITLEGHQEGVTTLLISPDGHTLLSEGYLEGRICLWQLTTGQMLHTIETERGAVPCLVPGGERILLDRRVNKAPEYSLWDLSTRRFLRSFPGDQGCHITPDGSKIITGSSQREMRIWHIPTGQCLHHLTAGLPLAITPDGNRLLAYHPDNSLCLWQIDTGKLQQRVPCQARPQNTIISPDSRMVIAGCSDQTLRIWELESAACVSSFEGQARIDRLAFCGQGRYLVTSHMVSTNLYRKVVWRFHWDYQLHEAAEWDAGARPYLETFLSLHTPYRGELPQDREPTDEEITLALTRSGIPTWTDADFQGLMHSLGPRGYGWLCEEGVRRKLHELAEERLT